MASSSKAPAGPPASAHELARNRQQLRAMQTQLDNSREEMTAVTSSGLADVQCKANDMFAVSKQEARNSALDASLLHTVSKLGAEQAGKLDKQSPEELVKRLVAGQPQHTAALLPQAHELVFRPQSHSRARGT